MSHEILVVLENIVLVLLFGGLFYALTQLIPEAWGPFKRAIQYVIIFGVIILVLLDLFKLIHV